MIAGRLRNVIFFSLLCLGCNQQQGHRQADLPSAPPHPASTTTDASSDSVDHVTPQQATAEQQDAPGVAAVGLAPVPPSAKATPNKQPNASPTNSSPPWSRGIPYRFVLLTDGCPTLVSLQVLVGDRSMDDAARAAAGIVLPYLDTDGSGFTSWEEAASAPLLSRFSRGMELPRGRQRDLLFRSYDTNGDAKVDPDELIGFVNRGLPSRSWLVIRPNLADSTKLNSPLGLVLDRNGDQRIDGRELASASARLRMLDSDDDGVLLSGELSNPMPAYMVYGEQNGYSRELPVFFLDDDHADFGDLLFRLQEKYFMGAPLLPEDLVAWSEAWQDLDVNHDEAVWEDELVLIKDRSADITIRVQFPLTFDDDTVTFQIESQSGRVTQQSERSADVDTLHGRLSFGVANTETIGGDVDDIQQIVDRADLDKDGQISVSEFESLQPVFGLGFQVIDKNDDGHLTRDELESLSNVYQTLNLIRIELWLQSSDDAMFAAIDDSHDHRLSLEEIAQSSDRLRRLDRDGDGILQPGEANAGTSATIRRGFTTNGPLPDQIRVPQRLATTSPPSPSPPDWFRSMDANHNGWLERSEFLGRLDDFERADTDGNSSLTWQEASSLCTSVRVDEVTNLAQ